MDGFSVFHTFLQRVLDDPNFLTGERDHVQPYHVCTQMLVFPASYTSKDGPDATLNMQD